jgi:signal transduction histidine kinase
MRGVPSAQMRLPLYIQRHAFDLLILAMAVFGMGEVLFNDQVRGSNPGLIAFALLWGLPLLARRRWPVAAPTAVFAVLMVQAIIWPQSIPYSFGIFVVVMFAVGQFGNHFTGLRGRLIGAAIVAGAIVWVVWRDPAGQWDDLITLFPTAGLAWLVGHAYRGSMERTAELRERAERLERERETQARTAVAEERARIAREMHDVVAHSLSVMVVQAEAAAAMLDVDPERARRPLSSVQDTGRLALGELRRMLGALRESDESGAQLAPQPGLDGIDDLVASVRAAGLPVAVKVEGDVRPLPPGVDLSAYRIVQEGLTNALKHAGPARAAVLVRFGDRELELRVSDDGRGHDPSSNGDGHGLVGMRERVALYGGQLEAGRQPGGGYLLSARLPLDPTRAS